MKCPYCKNRLVQKSGNQIRLRTQGQIIFGEDGKCRSQCYWCKRVVELPIRLQDGLEIPTEKFFLAQQS